MANQKLLYIINHLGDSNKNTMRYQQKDLKNQNRRDHVFGRDKTNLVAWKLVRPLWKTVKWHLLKLSLWPSNAIPRNAVTCSPRDEQGHSQWHLFIIIKNRKQLTSPPTRVQSHSGIYKAMRMDKSITTCNHINGSYT